MITLIHTEKSLDWIQQTFMIKTFHNLGLEGTHLSTKAGPESTAAKSAHSEESWKLSSKNKTRVLTLPISIQHSTGSSSHPQINQINRSKTVSQILQERFVSTKKHKMNSVKSRTQKSTSKSVMFLYTNNKCVKEQQESNPTLRSTGQEKVCKVKTSLIKETEDDTKDPTCPHYH